MQYVYTQRARYSTALCKLVVTHAAHRSLILSDFVEYHLARSTPPSLSSKAVSFFDDDIRRASNRCMGVNTSNITWEQAQLSLSRGGLGLWSLSHYSSAAFISSICSSGFGSQSVHHLSQAIEVFNNLVSPEKIVTSESVLLSLPTRKQLSSKLDLFNHLLNLSPLADKAHQLSISSPHASAWMSVTPSESFGLHLDPPMFQVAIKWWLGLVTSEGSQYALCLSSALDRLSHREVTCKYGGDVVSHRNRVMDILVEPVVKHT